MVLIIPSKHELITLETFFAKILIDLSDGLEGEGSESLGIIHVTILSHFFCFIT